METGIPGCAGASMFARCPICRRRVSAMAGLLVNGREVRYWCRGCFSELVLIRAWRWARRVSVLVFWIGLFLPSLFIGADFAERSRSWQYAAAFTFAMFLTLGVLMWLFPQ